MISARSSPRSVPSSPASLPRLAPLAKVRRVALIAREVRERLGDTALELLFGEAKILAEGQAASGGRGHFYGTVLLTLDLARAGAALRGADEPAGAARRVADLMSRDLRVDRRLRALALAEAERRAGKRLLQPQIELRFKARDERVLIDADVEGELS